MNGELDQTGPHTFGVPLHVGPDAVASNARSPLPAAVKTVPAATVGEDMTSPSESARQMGEQTFGVTVPQLLRPAASKARRLSRPRTYTLPPATAGDVRMVSPTFTAADQRGSHDFGVVFEHPPVPVASNAYNRPSAAPTYATPSTTAGAVVMAPPVMPDQDSVRVETFAGLIPNSSAWLPL